MNNTTHYVWDISIRTFHWLLVILIFGSYLTSELSDEWLYWHSNIGQLIFALLIFRITWGFVGTDCARFSSFLTNKNKKPYIGHSPLGGLSVITMLLLLLAQVLSGMFSLNDEIDISGPLYNLVNSSVSSQLTLLHSQISSALLAIISIHIIAVIFYFIIKRKNLIAPMFTGYKQIYIRSLSTHNNHINLSRFLFSITFSVTLYWLVNSGVFEIFFTNQKYLFLF